MILIIAKLVVKEGMDTGFIEKTKPLIAGSNAEAGCIEYNLYRDRENTNVFHFVEKWKDSDAIKAHQAAPHYINSGLDEYVAEKEVTFHNPV